MKQLAVTVESKLAAVRHKHVDQDALPKPLRKTSSDPVLPVKLAPRSRI